MHVPHVLNRCVPSTESRVYKSIIPDEIRPKQFQWNDVKGQNVENQKNEDNILGLLCLKKTSRR